MSARDEILASLGIAPAEPASRWLKDNGWTFWATRPDRANAPSRKWHFMRSDGRVLRSLCGAGLAPIGTDLAESGWKSQQACKECLATWRAERAQPELTLSCARTRF